MRRLLALFLICMMLMPSQASAKETFTVIIDAGHGGGDVGTPHRKGRQDEKTIALNVALKLGQLVKDNHQDVKIVYTRTTDVYPTLPERTQIARKAKGNLFISIHVNAAENTSARGFETYVFGITGLAGKSASEQARIRQRTMIERENLDINGKQIDFEKTVDMQTKILCQTQREKHNIYSKEFADQVQTSLINALKRSSYRGNVNDRGVKEKNIYVLCYSPMPAILVELGYMSNVTEERFLNTLEAQNLFATSLYDAFATYKQNWEKRQLDYNDGNSETPSQNEATAADKSEQPELKDVKLNKKNSEAEEARKAAEEKAAAEAKAAKEKADAEAKIAAEKAAAEKAAADAKAAKEKADAEAKAAAEAAKAVAKPEGPFHRIQFLVSPQKLEKGDARLKGLWPVEYYQDGNVYKYTIGNATDRNQLQSKYKEVKALFPDAFWVKFDAEGHRIK